MTPDAHDNEYLAAAAGMADTYGYAPKRGDVVDLRLPFSNDYATGVVLEVDGSDVQVSVNGETLLYRAGELRPVTTDTESRRSR